MRLDRQKKEKLVEDVQGKFKMAKATFIAEYKGMKAVEMNEIRKVLRDASIDLKIVRNTLARRAVKGTRIEHISEKLAGATAIAFSYNDPAQAAKTLVQFAKDTPNLKLKMGTLGDKIISLEEIKGLAELPPREVLIGMFLATLKSPSAGLVGVLSGVPRKFLYALNAIQTKKAEGQQQ